MSRSPRIVDVELRRGAPEKPAAGAPCNGCGLCCALEPCPLGRLRFQRWQGACPALLWREEEQRYRCGLIVDAQRYWPLPRPLLPLAMRLTRRWIAAGRGCDCDVDSDDPSPGRCKAGTRCK